MAPVAPKPQLIGDGQFSQPHLPFEHSLTIALSLISMLNVGKYSTFLDNI